MLLTVLVMEIQRSGLITYFMDVGYACVCLAHVGGHMGNKRNYTVH